MGLIDRYRCRQPEINCLVCWSRILLILLLITACGRKGAPTLSSYEKPRAPALLMASQKEGAMSLSWSYPSDREKTLSGFLVLRSSGTGFKKIAMVDSGVRSFIDIDVEEGSTYQYKVISRNFQGISSSDSNVVTAPVVRPPEPPSCISWKITDDNLVLSWEKTGADIFYNVYKTYSKDNYVGTAANMSPLSECFFREALPLNRPVFYYIRSLIRDSILAEGPPSRKIMITPDDLLPPAPEAVRWVAAADRIYLYWKEPDITWLKGFKIYRKFTSQEEYNLIGETQIPSFVDEEAPRRIRSYRITAVGPSREGSSAEIYGVGFVQE
jgi:hypothetical protein